MELPFTEDGMPVKGQELSLGCAEFLLKWSCSVSISYASLGFTELWLEYKASEQGSLREKGARQKEVQEMKDPRRQQPGN